MNFLAAANAANPAAAQAAAVPPAAQPLPPAAAGGAPVGGLPAGQLAAGAAVGLGGVQLLAAPMTARPYREWYADATRDPFIGNYLAMYANYALTAANTPQAVRDRIFANGNNGVPIGHLLLIRPANAAVDNPGTIQGFHRIVRYQASLVRATPFDGTGYAFLGDVQNGQTPHSVVWADDYFTRAGNVQVPTSAHMDQLLATDPNATQVGPFPAGTVDTEMINTRYGMYIPNRYMTLLLDDGMTPREAWQRVRGALVTDGNAASCQLLIDWLRVALTRRELNIVSPLARDIPATQGIASIADANAYQSFRAGIVARDHPNLSTNQVTQGAQLVAQGLTDIADQARLQREADEVRRHREVTKTPADLFPTGLDKLMRWCQVASEAELPVLYTTAASHKKGERRKVLQDAVNSSMEELGYHHDFPVTTKISNKVFDLEWGSRLADDLSLGLNNFTLGWVVEEDAELLKARNAQADALYGGHAQPSLADTEAILEHSDDVHIPRTFAQHRYGIEQSHAMWRILLGPAHELVNQHRLYRATLVDKEMELEREVPRNPSYRFIVPALLARRVQIDVNVWLQDQSRTNRALPLDSLNDVFVEIKRQKDWAPNMPPAYFRAAPPIILDDQSTGSALTDSTMGTRGTGSSAGGTATQPPPAAKTEVTQAMQQNKAPNPAYAPFQAMGILTKALKDRCRDQNIPWPKTVRGDRFCPTFHIKSMCNTRCGNAADHRQHTAEEDATLVKWCEANYKLD